VYEHEEALKSGTAVVVSASQLLRALVLAKLPCDRFAFGGADWRKTFELDGFDQLREVAHG